MKLLGVLLTLLLLTLAPSYAGFGIFEFGGASVPAGGSCWGTSTATGFTNICSTAATHDTCANGLTDGTCIVSVDSTNVGGDTTCDLEAAPSGANVVGGWNPATWAPLHTCQTITKAMTLMRNGSPDWLLIKAGTVYREGPTGGNQLVIRGNGLSATAPWLYGTYGTGARPLLITSCGVYSGFSDSYKYFLEGAGGGVGFSVGNHLAFIGLEFYDSDRDPTNTSTTTPFFNPSFINCGTTGLGIGTQLTSDALIEDCKISYQMSGLGLGANASRQINSVADNGAGLVRLTLPTTNEQLYTYHVGDVVTIYQVQGPFGLNGNWTISAVSLGTPGTIDLQSSSSSSLLNPADGGTNTNVTAYNTFNPGQIYKASGSYSNGTIKVRRNIIVNNYAQNSSGAAAIHVNGVNNLILEENIIDHAWWGIYTVTWGFNHDLYVSVFNNEYDTNSLFPAPTLTGNIFARDPSAIAARGNQTAAHNLYWRNPSGPSLGAPLSFAGTNSYDVYTDGQGNTSVYVAPNGAVCSVTQTVVASNPVTANCTSAPSASGTLYKVMSEGDASITYSSVTANGGASYTFNFAGSATVIFGQSGTTGPTTGSTGIGSTPNPRYNVGTISHDHILVQHGIPAYNTAGSGVGAAHGFINNVTNSIVYDWNPPLNLDNTGSITALTISNAGTGATALPSFTGYIDDNASVVFTTSASQTVNFGCSYTNNGQTFWIGAGAGNTTITTGTTINTGPAYKQGNGRTGLPTTSGNLINTTDSTMVYSTASLVSGSTYQFNLSAPHTAAAGCIVTIGGNNYTIQSSISGSNTLLASGSPAPPSGGSNTLSAGDGTLAFSSWLPVAGNTMTVTSITGTPLTINMGISGTSIPANTYITGVLSGSGGVGTYSVNMSGSSQTNITLNTFATKAITITALNWFLPLTKISCTNASCGNAYAYIFVSGGGVTSAVVQQNNGFSADPGHFFTVGDTVTAAVPGNTTWVATVASVITPNTTGTVTCASNLASCSPSQSYPDPNRSLGSYYATLPSVTPNAVCTSSSITSGVATLSGCTGNPILPGDALTWTGQTAADVIISGFNGTYTLRGTPTVTGPTTINVWSPTQFINAAENRAGGTWDPNYGACKANSYLFAGYGITDPGGCP